MAKTALCIASYADALSIIVKDNKNVPKGSLLIVFLLVFVSPEKDLIHEAQMHKLRHPNIVMLIAVIFEPGHYGVVFEYVKYGGLDNFLEDYEVRFAITTSVVVKDLRLKDEDKDKESSLRTRT